MAGLRTNALVAAGAPMFIMRGDCYQEKDRGASPHTLFQELISGASA
jgi:uncharacterized membrane protein YhiD involved in acid resistance